jgi:uncharacterized membrane protein YjjP (DUF1212 family)
MDYNTLLDLATDLGYELAMSGAETFRVEESINRIMASYGITSEVFAIPNCLTVSIETPEGQPMTRMRRIGFHGNDLDAVERFNGLSRAICNRKPEPQEARRWFQHVQTLGLQFSLPIYLLGNFLGAFGFGFFFGGTFADAFWGGLCGIVLGLVGKVMSKLKVNQFFNTIISAFLSALIAYSIASFGLMNNVDSSIIGTLMILVPGLLFTNAMRDIIYGDTNSGINRIVQVLLIAMAIALGTAAAWNVTDSVWSHGIVNPPITYSAFIQCLVSLIGCIGFAILFNIHGKGIWLCALGGMLTWAVYLLAFHFGAGLIGANFWAALFASAYSEGMARIRKSPAIAYLVVSVFPLLPGAGIYYTVSFALQGQMEEALHKGLETGSVAGVMAVGILLVSSAVRALNSWKSQKA